MSEITQAPQDQAIPEGAISVDVNLVLQGYRDALANANDQLIMLSSRNKQLETANTQLIEALQRAQVALQAAADREASKEIIPA